MFCEVRDPVEQPLCEFYASALRRLMHLFELDADVMTDRCRGHRRPAVHDVSRCSAQRSAGRRLMTGGLASRRRRAPRLGSGRRRSGGRARDGLHRRLPRAVLGTAAAQSVPAPAARPSVLVVPFKSAGRDPRGYWLREASAVILTDDLVSLGVSAMSRDERLRAFESLRVPAVADLSHATVIRVGQVVGAARRASARATSAATR